MSELKKNTNGKRYTFTKTHKTKLTESDQNQTDI